MKSEFLKILQERGLINQATDLEATDNLLSKKSIVAYCGFDPTADSLHIGNLVAITMLRWLQKTGHKPIALVGGGTGKVGDPSFKDDARPYLEEAQLKKNLKGIKKSLEKFIKLGRGKTEGILVDNDAWLSKLKYMDFLRDYGRHFSINRMLSFESVKTRLDREQSLSFLEFNYMVLQAYDFLELNRKYDCQLQIAGADQWGNMVNGVELIRRKDGKEVYGLTAALITDHTGKKFGKSEGNAIWLNEERRSPYDYYQFWRNVDDADVGKLLRIFTELPIKEIEKLERLKDQEINEAKKILAFEATKLCHGEKEAEKAGETARKTFEEGGAGSALPTLTLSTFEGVTIADLLVQTGLCPSKGEAKRLIQGGGGYMNDEKLTDPNAPVLKTHFKKGEIKLASGKKKFAIVKVKGS